MFKKIPRPNWFSHEIPSHMAIVSAVRPFVIIYNLPSKPVRIGFVSLFCQPEGPRLVALINKQHLLMSSRRHLLIVIVQQLWLERLPFAVIVIATVIATVCSLGFCRRVCACECVYVSSDSSE